MARKRNLEQEQNEAPVTLAVFLDAYNLNLPQGYPTASAKILKKFQASHPLLFDGDNTWSVDKHRKRLMDWLTSHRDD